MRDGFRIFCLLATFSVALATHAQEAEEAAPRDYIIKALKEGDVFDYDIATGMISAPNGIRVIYHPDQPDSTELTADKATLKQDTGQVTATGNVILRREGQIWKADSLEYNFKTRNFKTAAFRGGDLKYFIRGTQLEGSQTNGVYTARGVLFTQDDTPDPTAYIRSQKVVITPGKRIEFYGASLHVGKIPVAYLPYYKRDLERHPWNMHLEPGYRSQWGPYLLTATRWPGTPQFGGEMNLDYRVQRGFAFGPDFKWDAGRWGSGQLESYFAFDDDPMNDSNSNPLNRERQRLRFTHRANWDRDTQALGVINFESDEYMRRDFFENEYRENIQPKSFLELNRNWENYNLNLLAQPRLNDHYGTVERLPDLRFSGLRQQIGEGPFYYDTETSAGYFKRKYADSSSPWFGGSRFDTLHQVYLPQTFGGWLNVTPRVGGRLTHYGETDGPGSTIGTADRVVFNTGVEFSTKASRLYPDAESKFFEMNGLRHIVEPSFNYVYVPRPNEKPADLPQYDYEVTSPRLLPIMYPDYNAIDAVDAQNVLRMGLRNRLQTRRNNQLEDMLDWAIYTDWRLNPLTDQQTFAGLFNDLRFRPRSWLSLGSNLRYDLDDGMWRMINNSITFEPKTNWGVTLGNFYYLEPGKTSKADRDSVAYTSFSYRFNEEWSFSTYHYYDTKRGRMSDHSYTLYRDFRSWVGYLDLRFIDSVGTTREDDFQISLNFSFKTYPRAPKR